MNRKIAATANKAMFFARHVGIYFSLFVSHTSAINIISVSLLLNSRDLLCHTQGFKNFRGCFVCRQHVMAQIAVLSDRFTILSNVGTIVTTKAAGEIRVTEVILIRTPG